MTLKTRIPDEWGERQLRVKDDCLMSRFIFYNQRYYERNDFATPKFLRIKIRRLL